MDAIGLTMFMCGGDRCTAMVWVPYALSVSRFANSATLFPSARHR